MLKCSYCIKVGNNIYNLTAVDSIFLPRKAPHAWIQVSDRGKMSVVLPPAGKLENFFVTTAALDHEPKAEDIVRIFKESEMQIVGPHLKSE